MSQNAQATVAPPQANGQGMRGEIANKWPKLTAADITALKNKADLVAQVQSNTQAQSDVDAFAAGRQL
jgi:ABC-type uncharacterized transport system involved in gliding motility auxiliary subunit